MAQFLCKKMTGNEAECPDSSPCPSSSSSDDSNKNSNEYRSNSSGNTSESDDKQSGNNASNNHGKGDDDDKDKKEDGDDDNSSDSGSISDSSAMESDCEEEDRILIDMDDEKDKTCNELDPIDDDDSEESDESSELENSYPRLPPAPVDSIIKIRQEEARKELQLSEKVKQKIVADARQRHQERQEAQRSRKKKMTLSSKRRHSKSEVVSANSTHMAKHDTNSSTGVVMARQEQEGDEWMVDCSCGLKRKNYDDGTSMIQCDSCSHWVHAKCADKQPETVARERFLCFRCSWMFDCVCSIRRRPNHDDGQRMVECESCNTWQHTMCVGIPMTDEPADDYRCPRCVKRGRRRKSASKGSRNRNRQRKQRHTEPTRHHEEIIDAFPVATVRVRSSVPSMDALTTINRSHRSRRADQNQSSWLKKAAAIAPTPPIPAASPPPTPPPPSSPPPSSAMFSHAHSGCSSVDRRSGRNKRKSEREQEVLAESTTLLQRKRDQSVGSCPSSGKKIHSKSSEIEHNASPSTAVTSLRRGKGLMLREYSSTAIARTASSSQSVNIPPPPPPLTPPSTGVICGNSYNNHKRHGRKRNVSSARDRLAKKLKMRKSLLR